jgi:hypothetical protein
MRHGARGGGQREHRDTTDDRADAPKFAPADRFVQQTRSDHEQRQQTRRKHRLHQRQWRQHQRPDLRQPADQRQAGSGQPAPARCEPLQQRQAQRMIGGQLASVERLDREAEVVQRGGGECGQRSCENGTHAQASS